MAVAAIINPTNALRISEYSLHNGGEDRCLGTHLSRRACPEAELMRKLRESL
jgi:hypothetical protein